MLVTGFYEAYLASHPFLRKSLFHDISSIITYIAAAIQGLMVRFTPAPDYVYLLMFAVSYL